MRRVSVIYQRPQQTANKKFFRYQKVMISVIDLYVPAIPSQVEVFISAADSPFNLFRYEKSSGRYFGKKSVRKIVRVGNLSVEKRHRVGKLTLIGSSEVRKHRISRTGFPDSMKIYSETNAPPAE